MEYIIEYFKDGIDFSHQINTGPEIELHIHNYLEIYLFLDGNVQFFIDSQSIMLKKGDLMVIRNDQIHGPNPLSLENYERYIVHLPRELIVSLSSEETDLTACFSNDNDQSIINISEEDLPEIIQILNQIENVHHTNCYAENLLTNFLLGQLLILINKHFKNRQYTTIQNNLSGKIQQVVQYIQENLTQELTLTILEEEFQLSRYYLNRMFKKEIGSTIYQYILLSRISLAKRLLAKNMSVTEICFFCGFNDYSNFIRTFKKVTGLAPKQYFQQIINH